MAKSFIEVVQDAPRTGLGIPVKTKKPPLSNQYTTRGKILLLPLYLKLLLITIIINVLYCY